MLQQAIETLFDARFDIDWLYLFDVGIFIVLMIIFTIYFFTKLYLSRKIDDKEILEKKSFGINTIRNIIIVLFVMGCVTARSYFLVDRSQPEGLNVIDYISILGSYFFSFGRFIFLLGSILLYSYFLKWLFKTVFINKLIKNKPNFRINVN